MGMTIARKQIIAGALLTATAAFAGIGAAASAQADDASYWQYCPGQHWQYTTPVPPGTDLGVCHWFAATPSATPSGGITWKLVEVDQSQLPDWAQPRPMCGLVPCQGGA
jgi:hypothetical protein